MNSEQNNDAMSQFQIEYIAFMEKYNNSPMSGEEIGKQIARHGQHFADASSGLASAKIAYNQVLAIREQSLDETTGKPLSSAKAERITAATPEGAKLVRANSIFESIDNQITTLFGLQRGALKEWDNVNRI